MGFNTFYSFYCCYFVKQETVLKDFVGVFIQLKISQASIFVLTFSFFFFLIIEAIEEVLGVEIVSCLNNFANF